jgi:hypothetical protein
VARETLADVRAERDALRELLRGEREQRLRLEALIEMVASLIGGVLPRA